MRRMPAILYGFYLLLINCFLRKWHLNIEMSTMRMIVCFVRTIINIYTHFLKRIFKLRTSDFQIISNKNLFRNAVR